MEKIHTALILAAGRGSRLGDKTEVLPKGLVELGGKPLLAWQIAALREAGLNELGIVTGYRADRLDFPGVQTFHNPRWQQTQMVRSLACASQWLESRSMLLSYADILTSPACLQALKNSPGDLVITSNLLWQSLWQARFEDPLADVESFKTDGQGHLCEIGGRASSLTEIEGQYMGLLKITPVAWRWIAALLAELPADTVDRLDMTSLLSRLLQKGHVIDVLSVNEPWLELDTPEDLELYLQSLQSGKLHLPLQHPVLW